MGNHRIHTPWVSKEIPFRCSGMLHVTLSERLKTSCIKNLCFISWPVVRLSAGFRHWSVAVSRVKDASCVINSRDVSACEFSDASYLKSASHHTIKADHFMTFNISQNAVHRKTHENLNFAWFLIFVFVRFSSRSCRKKRNLTMHKRRNWTQVSNFTKTFEHSVKDQRHFCKNFNKVRYKMCQNVPKSSCTSLK